MQLPLRPNEQIFGLGLQFLSFAQRGKKKVVRVNADPKFDTGDSHAPVPFYVTTEGIGILIDTARYATFYFGDARPKPTHAADLVNNANPDPNYTHNIQDGDTGQITVEVPRASGVDVYLFAGPEMLDAVRRYNVFSGGGVVPPEWGLGFWYRHGCTRNTTICAGAGAGVPRSQDALRRDWTRTRLADARVLLHIRLEPGSLSRIPRDL